MVAVGNKLYASENFKTFHDFLRYFIVDVLGWDWFIQERTKNPEEQHQIVRWFHQAERDKHQMVEGKNGIFSGPMTGANKAFLNLAYNLYLIAHHSPPERATAILASFVERLRSARPDDFTGKLFETYASAAFLKAGFKLEYENEKDGRSSHVEFVATHPKTGKTFAVEVKSRVPSANKDEGKKLRVAKKLTLALGKKTQHIRIVMIEVNIPDLVGQEDISGTWVETAIAEIKHAETFQDSNGEPYPPAYVIVTNHAYHNNLEVAAVGIQVLAEGYRIPDFGRGTITNNFKHYLDVLDRHQEVLALLDSVKTHSRIPVTFDGELPEFVYGAEDGMPRLHIGVEYLVPNGDGDEVPGVLQQAVVIEEQAKAWSIYRLRNGKQILISHELTEREMRAWKQHPETFFGQVEEEKKQASNWLQLAEFFYATYRNVSKEQLLELMQSWPDPEQLKTLDQADLAILYCERMALSAWHRDQSGDAKVSVGV